jgi:hypothetical protein
VVGCLVNSLSLVPRNLLTALGEVNLVARYQAIEMVPYFLLTIILIGRFGAAGAAVAWSVRIIVEYFLLSRCANRIAGMNLVPLPEHPGKYFLCMVIAFLPMLIMPLLAQASPIRYALVVLCLTIYAMLSPKALLNGEEMSWVREKIMIDLRGRLKF